MHPPAKLLEKVKDDDSLPGDEDCDDLQPCIFI